MICLLLSSLSLLVVVCCCLLLWLVFGCELFASNFGNPFATSSKTCNAYKAYKRSEIPRPKEFGRMREREKQKKTGDSQIGLNEKIEITKTVTVALSISKLYRNFNVKHEPRQDIYLKASDMRNNSSIA